DQHFSRYIASARAEELLQMVFNPDDYLPAAVAAAEAELDARDLSDEEREQAEEIALSKVAMASGEKARRKTNFILLVDRLRRIFR
ncbi:MAG: hypothetical protein AAF206_31830, partial [Bacteroidota bacterium]